MGLATRTAAVLDWVRTNGKQKFFLFVATAIVLSVLAACESGPTVTSGKIVEKHHTEDVEVTKDVCVKYSTKTVKQNGKVKKVKTCVKQVKKEVEVTPDIYQFKLNDGTNEGWVSVDEETYDDYDENEQYP